MAPPRLGSSGAGTYSSRPDESRVLTPKTGSNRNSLTAAFNQSNMIILVDTDAGITGVGEGGSPDLVASLAPIVIGRNALDTELIWQHMYMDPFYSPGGEDSCARWNRHGALGYQGEGAERPALYVVRR